MTTQKLIHWLEVGEGARWLRRVALLLGILVLSLLVAHKQFRGPLTEQTLREADVGRSVAAGEGFATRVNFPQTAAFLRERGVASDPAVLFPELHQPPLYSALIGAVLRGLPGNWRATLFADALPPPNGFAADYFLLALNLLLLWLAAWQTWRLGRRLFDTSVGLVAALGVLLSVSVWERTVAVNGTPLMMVLLLGLFQALAAAEAARSGGLRDWPWWLAAGVLCGLSFLGEYTAGVLLPLVAGYAAWRGRGPAAGLVIGGALLVAAPWLARNLAVTGSPVGLAWHDVALRAGDSTAEPAVGRATLSAAAPDVDLNKLGNKGLTVLEENLRDRLWSGGGIFFTAFFVAGWLYRFRRDDTQRLRGLFAAILGALVLAQGFLNSGEAERLPVFYATPLIVLFGAGFFSVLVSSSNVFADHAKLAAAGLLALQALPLAHDVLEPRRLHFHYPPYYPSFFQGMRAEMARRGGAHPAWMADVPAGAAWYSGQRVWAQPVQLREFFEIHAEQPIVALVLTPRTLDRPFLSELTGSPATASRFGAWSAIYTGLLSSRLPADFPLAQPQKLADNFYVLLDPRRVPLRGK